MSDHDITIEMDAFALELMKQARTQTDVGLADRLATFNSIGKWLSIKHGLADSDDEGTHLHDLKSRLKSDAPEPAPRRRPGRPFAGADPDEAGAGSTLDKLRAKLPAIGNGGHNRGFRRIGRNSGGPPFTPVGGGGSIPADLSGGDQSEPDGDGGSDQLRSDNLHSPDLAVRKEGVKDAG